MALIKFGSLVVAASGKIGGQYFGGSTSGSTIVTNPKQRKNSAFGSQTGSGTSPFTRAAISSALIYVVKSWKSVSAANKLAWQMAAPNFPTVNRFGVPIKPSAYHCYVHVNYGYYLNNNALLAAPPANTVGIAPQAFTIVAVSSTEIKINIPVAIPAGYSGYVKCTRSLSAGIKATYNDFSLVLIPGAGIVGNYTITTQYGYKFGAPITGNYLWISLTMVNLQTGIKGQPYILGSPIS